MTNVGITGHQGIPAKAIDHVVRGIRTILGTQKGPIIGYTSLAVGSDQLFADLILEAGGTLVAVVPSNGYETTFSEENLADYQNLLSKAEDVVVLDFSEPTEEAFMAAGAEVARRSDLLLAVWDGQPAAGLGGTADAVWYAWSLGKPVVNVWPKGVKR